MTKDEAIKQALQTGGGLVPFEGQNCHEVGDTCDGWDGISRRCECGNRRVSWEVYRDDHGDGVTVEAVAY
jgi:hypothetical protein